MGARHHLIRTSGQMNAGAQILNWIAEHEAIFSGIAAAIVIVGVIGAMSSRTLGLLRSRSRKENNVAASKLQQTTQTICQEIRFCRLPDGHKVAWSSAGNGYPLIRSLGWFTNLEMEWNSPVSAPFWQQLASRYRLIRYDGRGMGLSDRDVQEFSPATRLEDLEVVIEASGAEKFALMGLSEGGSTAIKYAHKYPERVSHLIIWGSFLVPPDRKDVPQFGPIAKLMPKHWGGDSAAFHQMFTAMFLPEGNAAQNKLFNEMQRTSAAPDTAFLFTKSISEIDVRDIANQVRVPALVIHRKGDLVIPVKYGQNLAAQLRNSRIVLLDGSNHWMVAQDDTDYIVSLIDEFLSDSDSQPDS